MIQATLAKQLNETHRDALLTYYKCYVAPELAGESVTDEDIYQYLLIDPDVSEDVKTSQVAQTISSLQQYLYRIALNKEPGFEPMQQENLDEWRDIESQYAIWSAAQQVSDYPENYISPSTRQGKSLFFRELENTLNQNQLDPDRVQDAVLTYLNKFEDVSNLLVVNGYCNQIEFKQGKYFFIGRTAEQPYHYYWRSMDLNKAPGNGEFITPNCWNDWQPVDLPLSGDSVLNWTVRPVYFNNRLYVTWAERNPAPTVNGGTVHKYTIHYAYLRYDDTWSAPAVGDLQTTSLAALSTPVADKSLDVDESGNFDPKSVDTVAHVDFNRSIADQLPVSARVEGNLFIGLFRYKANVKGIEQFPDRAFVYCDTSMIDLQTVSTLMEANFERYKPGNIEDDITILPIQYCSIGKEFELVAPPKSEGTEDDHSWGLSFPPPTVKILSDGITLEVLGKVGNCPDTANDPYRKNKWFHDPSVEVPVHNATLQDAHGLDGQYSIDWFCDSNGNRIDNVWLTKSENRYKSSGLYICIGGLNPVISSTVLLYNEGKFVDSFNISDFHPNQSNPNSITAYNLDINTAKKFDSIYMTITNKAGYTYILTNYIDMSGTVFLANDFRPEIYLNLQYNNERLEEKRLPELSEYNPGSVLDVNHSIDLIHDVSSRSENYNGYYNYRIIMQMIELSGKLQINKGTQKWTFQVKLKEHDSTPITGPTIHTRYDTSEGNVQFLSFEGMEQNDQGIDATQANIGALSDGGWIILWYADWRIHQQRYDRMGKRVAAETVVLPNGGYYREASVAGLQDGGWVVAWNYCPTGHYWCIQQQCFNRDGTPRGRSIDISGHQLNYRNPCVAALNNGGWVVVWQNESAPWDIQQCFFSADGVKSNITTVNKTSSGATLTLSCQRSVVAGLLEGGWVVTWVCNVGNTYIVKMRHYDLNGNPHGEERDVYTSQNIIEKSCICALDDGGWVVAWNIKNAGILQKRFNKDANEFSNEVITVNTYVYVGTAFPDMTGLDDGGWIVTWQSKVDNSSRDWDVFQQRYNSEGEPVNTEILVNSFTAGSQNMPVIVGLSDDKNSDQDSGWVVAWVSNKQSFSGNSVYQQHYSYAGKAIGGEELVSAQGPTLVRLNTTFVPLLIEKANVSLSSLLSYSTQATKVEPPLMEHPNSESELVTMDYTGANGLYFWELFFHVPFMVASRFACEGQNELAQHWYHYIFEPGARNRAEDAESDIKPPDYWNNYAISSGAEQSATNSYISGGLLDPDALAYAHPVIYQKAVYQAYLRTLLALGDSQYRMVTPDGLTAARVYYDIAMEFLGPRPDVTLSEQWQPNSLSKISALPNRALRAFEEEAGFHLLDMPSRGSSFLSMLDNPQFRPPLNSELLGYWNTLDSRFYNLRNNLSIDGKPLNLPLYATPADPLALLTQRAVTGSQSGTGLPVPQIVLPYRFAFMLPVASAAVNMLTQYGDMLLSFLERGESAQQMELGQQQMVDLSGFAISLQQQELKALDADVEALNAQKAIAKQRFDFYWENYTGNISPAEQASMDLQMESGVMSTVEQSFYIAGGAADLAPNIFGFADGGMHYGALSYAVGSGFGLKRQSLELHSSRLAQAESYRRRRDEWKEQSIQAELESTMIDKQLDALAIRQQAVRTTIEQAKMQQKQQQAMLQFLTRRFTKASLYQWLSGQLSALYYQAYDSVLSLCMNVQSCWQYELGDFTTTFMRTNAWNNSYRGLLAGQALALDLQRMERAYYTRNERPLNISRTVSLRSLLGNSFEPAKSKGSFTFKLKEALFDNDYPGHYARRLQQVSITLPTLLGPYQNVRATLSQSSSSTLFKPDIEGVKYLNNPQTGSNTGVVTNLRPSQQVTLSGGLDDNGVFALMVQDGRYMPFEGTGVVSSWTLQFPRAVDEKVSGNVPLSADPEQKAMLEALDDVLVHIQYTALDGGAKFASAVRDELVPKSRRR
ncbi:neuraminidase-like domain-containing protein [Serratia sp. OS31]|uniref:Tc toxin subunit A-related protein n=1 Tax=Serratia sp. OS31 TaxID=2760844 RepID=UPI001602C87D|nr:neuraminidase-like domain-containing protein [Serratia sp. OS31]MBB1584757.1 hypothetical protein [Serratia sp. OS31]